IGATIARVSGTEHVDRAERVEDALQRADALDHAVARGAVGRVDRDGERRAIGTASDEARAEPFGRVAVLHEVSGEVRVGDDAGVVDGEPRFEEADRDLDGSGPAEALALLLVRRGSRSGRRGFAERELGPRVA